MTNPERILQWERHCRARAIEERAALERLKGSPRIQEALDALRTQAELKRAAIAFQRRRRWLLALEVLAGMLCAALAIYAAARLTMLLAK